MKDLKLLDCFRIFLRQSPSQVNPRNWSKRFQPSTTDRCVNPPKKKHAKSVQWDSVLENVKSKGKYGTGGARSSTVLHTRGGRSAYCCKVMSLQQVNFPSLRRVKSTPVAATPPTITRPNNSTHHHAQNCVTLDGYSRVATVSLGFSESDNIVFSLLKYFSRFCAMPLVFRAYFVTFLVVIRDTFRLTKSSSQVCVCVCVWRVMRLAS